MRNRKIISQREARRTRKELAELRDAQYKQRNRWSSDYPGGTHIETLNLTKEEVAAIYTAQKLGFAVVAKINGDDLLIYAVKP